MNRLHLRLLLTLAVCRRSLQFDSIHSVQELCETFGEDHALEKVLSSLNCLNRYSPVTYVYTASQKDGARRLVGYSIVKGHSIAKGHIPHDKAPFLATEIGKLKALLELQLEGVENFTLGLPTELGQVSKLRKIIIIGVALSCGIPTELSRVRDLRVVHFGMTKLLGSFPAVLFSLRSLTALKLDDSGLTGSIPKGIGKLKYLQEFSARIGDFEGQIPDFRNTQLKTLSIFSNKFQGSLPVIESAKLVRIDIDRNLIIGSIPSAVARLGALAALRLKNNSLTGTLPSELGAASLLTHFVASFNSLQGSLPLEFFGLLKLNYIGMESNSFTGSLPTEVGKLSCLSGFGFYGSRLTSTLPTEFGHLNSLASMWLMANRLVGMIPSELARASSLTRLDFRENSLEGCLPTEIGGVTELAILDVAYNSLSGRLPTEYGNLKRFASLVYSANSLTGSLPSEMSKLEKLDVVHLGYNNLTGSVPRGVFGLEKMKDLHYADNSLVGTVPPDIGRLTLLQYFTISFNTLSGTLPSDIGRLTNVAEFYGGGNHFFGVIPSEIGRMSRLQELCLRTSFFSGSLPTEIGLLEQLDLILFNKNRLTGTIPSELMKLQQLEVLSLPANSLQGSIPLKFGTSGKLKEVFLRRNGLTGQIPSEIDALDSISLLILDNNQMQGAFPELGGLKRLHALTLHSNKMKGNLTRLSQTPASLGLLTLHRNSFWGTVPPIQMQPWYSDSARYRDRGGYSCGHENIDDCEDAIVKESCPKHCAELAGSTPPYKDILLTLHRNILSCKLPISISGGKPVRSVVLMGNFFDDPRIDNITWVSAHEKEAEFLYNRSASWIDWAYICIIQWTIVLGVFLFVWNDLGSIRRRILSAAFMNNEDSIVQLNRLALSDIKPGVLIASLFIFPLCVFGAYGYYECGRRGAILTMAYFGDRPVLEWIATVVWSVWSFFCIWLEERSTNASTVTSRLRSSRRRAETDAGSFGSSTASFTKVSSEISISLRILGWFLWLVPLVCLSFPSFVYCVTLTLPRNNILFGRLDRRGMHILFSIHRCAPVLSTVINYLVLPNLTSVFSKMTGSRRIHLAMHVWTTTSWLMVGLSVLILHENCAGGWKYFWNVCKDRGPQSPMAFDENLGESHILRTLTDICGTSLSDIIQDDRCPRALIDTLAPLLHGSMSCWAFINPLAMLLKRFIIVRIGCLDKMQGRLRWKRTSDVAVLARVLEIIFVWGAFVPCLVPLGGIAILTNLITVQLRAYDMGSFFSIKDDLRLSFLRYYLIRSAFLGLILQLWFAFSFGMHGKYCLLVCLALLCVSRLYFKVDVWQRMSLVCQSGSTHEDGECDVNIELGSIECAGKTIAYWPPSFPKEHELKKIHEALHSPQLSTIQE